MKFQKINGAQNHHLFKPFNDKGEVRDVYWIRYFKTGKGRLEESLKTNILTDARIARDKRIAEFLGEKPRFVGKGILVEDIFPQFLELKKSKSISTYKSNEKVWRVHLKKAFGAILISDLNESSWLKYVIEDRKRKSEQKFFNRRKTLMDFLGWAKDNGHISTVPSLEIVDGETTAGKVFSKEEIEELLKFASPWGKIFILMGCKMMMRHGEIWSLEWNQVDLKAGTIHLPASKVKTRQSRTFAIAPEVLEMLKNLEIISQWVFPAIRDNTKPAGRHAVDEHWVNAKNKAGVGGRFHNLRHTGLTNAFKTSVNPALICEYAGLSLDVAQKTYLHFTVDDTRIVAQLFEVST